MNKHHKVFVLQLNKRTLIKLKSLTYFTMVLVREYHNCEFTGYNGAVDPQKYLNFKVFVLRG